MCDVYNLSTFGRSRGVGRPPFLMGLVAEPPPPPLKKKGAIFWSILGGFGTWFSNYGYVIKVVI
jgi:hypothetical protein